MPLSKKAWEENLARAQEDVILQAIKFRNEEYYLDQLKSDAPNQYVGTLFRSIDVLNFVFDSRPIRKPKLTITSFSFDEIKTPSPETESK